MAGFNEVKISRRLVLKRQGANIAYTIPAGAAIRRVQFLNRTTTAVSGGMRVGTTDGGAEVVAATAVGASALVEATVVTPAISTSAQTLYIQAVTAWGASEVDVAIEYDELLDSNGKQPNADGKAYLLHDPV